VLAQAVAKSTVIGMSTHYKIDALISLTIVFLSVAAFASMADARTMQVRDFKSIVDHSSVSYLSPAFSDPDLRACR